MKSKPQPLSVMDEIAAALAAITQAEVYRWATYLSPLDPKDDTEIGTITSQNTRRLYALANKYDALQEEAKAHAVAHSTSEAHFAKLISKAARYDTLADL